MSNQLERTQALIAAMEDRDLEDNDFHVLAHHARELARKLDAVGDVLHIQSTYDEEAHFTFAKIRDIVEGK